MPTFQNPDLSNVPLSEYRNRTDELLYEVLHELQNGSFGGGGGSPAGSDTQIQYNNGGSFGASDALLFESNILKIGVPNSINGTLEFFGNGTLLPEKISYVNSRLSIGSNNIVVNGDFVGIKQNSPNCLLHLKGLDNSSTVSVRFTSLDSTDLFTVQNNGFTSVNKAVQIQQEKFAVKSIGNSANAMAMFTNFDDELIHGFYEDKYVMNGRYLTVGNVLTPAATIHAVTTSTADESLRIDAINGQVGRVVNVRDHLGNTLLGVKTNGEIQIDTGSLPTATTATHSIPITVSGVGYYLLAYLQNP
jgi:hypothetical protein